MAHSKASHAAPRGPVDRRLLVAAAVAVALLLGVGVWAVTARGDDEAGGCGEDLVVAANPEIAPTVERVLGQLGTEDPCARFDIRGITASQVAEQISQGEAPDVWIPDSSSWVDKVDPRQGGGQWLEGPSIAKSPVVLAVGSDSRHADARPTSWSSLVAGDDDLRMANPDVDTSSRLAFHASRIGEPERIGLATGSRLIFMSRFAAPSVRSLMSSYADDPDKAQPFPASEQQLFAFDRDNAGVAPLKAVMPRRGTLVLDYPWIGNPTLAGDRLAAAEQARTAFGTTSTRDLLTEAGFRTSDGRGGPTVAAARPGSLRELDPLDRDERLAAVEQWDVLRTDMRMLALIDVSGSMEYASPTPGQTRWDVTKGALLKGVSILPAGSQVGGRIFSSDQAGGGQDWRELSPVRQLDAAAGSGTQRERLTRLVQGSDQYLGGDTGLYDSIWSAYQAMQRDYDDEYINSIVVFTDGANDDPNGGLSLGQLVRKIDDAYDADRPVRVITIGMGEADAGALQRISEESGGTSYIAETPDDIERVFVQALLARRS